MRKGIELKSMGCRVELKLWFKERQQGLFSLSLEEEVSAAHVLYGSRAFGHLYEERTFFKKMWVNSK